MQSPIDGCILNITYFDLISGVIVYSMSPSRVAINVVTVAAYSFVQAD